MIKDTISELLDVVELHFDLSTSQRTELKLYVENRSSKKIQDVLPVHLLDSRMIFNDVIEGIAGRLERLLSDKELDDLREDDNSRISCIVAPVKVVTDGDKAAQEGRKLCIRAEEIVSIPTREVNPVTIFSSLYGQPLKTVLKEEGITTAGRKNKYEIDFDYGQLREKRFDPVLERLYELNKISEEEHRFIRELIVTIDIYRMLFSSGNRYVVKGDIASTISVNKRVLKKDIDSAISNLIKAGKLIEQKEGSIEAAFPSISIGQCKVCGETFTKRRRTHICCKGCSDSPAYYRYKRKLKGTKTRGGKRPGAGRPKKIGS